jgi:hypothetical protein
MGGILLPYLLLMFSQKNSASSMVLSSIPEKICLNALKSLDIYSRLDIIIEECISTWTYPRKNQSVWIDWMVSIIRQMVSGVPAQGHKAGARGVARGGVSVWIRHTGISSPCQRSSTPGG